MKKIIACTLAALVLLATLTMYVSAADYGISPENPIVGGTSPDNPQVDGEYPIGPDGPGGDFVVNPPTYDGGIIYILPLAVLSFSAVLLAAVKMKKSKGLNH
jgi:hypothetical protein